LPKARVQTKQGETLKADIIPRQGKPYRDIQFSAESWISKRHFKRALRGILDLEYRGTDDDIQDIKAILVSQNPPIKQGVRTCGLHKIRGEWVYVEENLARDRNGKREDIAYLAENPYHVSLLQQPGLTSSQLDEILKYLFNFNSEDVVFPLLGFCFACFVKERIVALTGQNPILVCWGEKGSGKTATLKNVVKPLFGIKSPIENIAHPTEFGFARIISSSNLAPVLFDEHKTERLTQTQKDRISEMFRSVYNQTRLTRGTPQLEIVQFVYSAPVVVAGEIGIAELALKDRIIETYFSKKKIKDKEKEFKALSRCALSSLGKDFLLWTLSLEDKLIFELWEQQVEGVDTELKDRLRENTARARLGLGLFSKYLEEKTREPLHTDIFSLIDEAQKANILTETNKAIIDTIIEAFSVMAGAEILKKDRHWKIDDQFQLVLHISSIYPLFKKWAREHQWDGEMLDKRSFLKQLKERDYFVGYGSARLGQKSLKCHKLDVSKMQTLEIEEFVENGGETFDL